MHILPLLLNIEQLDMRIELGKFLVLNRDDE